MADADTQLGIDRGRHIFIVHPDHRRTAGEPLYLLKGAHPGGVESNKAHEIALRVGFQAVLQEAFQRLTGVYGEVPSSQMIPSGVFWNQSGVNAGRMVRVSAGTL